MPVDDALRLIEQNFGEYVKKARQRNIREVVPRDIRILICDLLDSRPLSMGDLDKLIKYLKERQSILVDDQIEQKRETAAGEMITGYRFMIHTIFFFNFFFFLSTSLCFTMRLRSFKDGSISLPPCAVA